MNSISKNSVSIAGEFAVLSQLALRGFDANMTLGHTKSVDILAADPISGKTFKIEVKTSYAGKPSQSRLFGYTLNWIMSEKHETISDPNLFYCFVNIEKDTNVFRFFIVPSHIVADYVRIQHQYWLDNKPHISKDYDKTIPMRTFRIGLDDTGYTIETALAKEYENNWEFVE